MLRDAVPPNPAHLASNWVNFFQDRCRCAPEWNRAWELFAEKFPDALDAIAGQVAEQVQKEYPDEKGRIIASTLLAIKIAEYICALALVLILPLTFLQFS